MRIRLRHKQLKVLLARRRLSQNGWAMRLGLDKGHLSRLLQGKQAYPGPATRRKLLDGLNVDFDQLFAIEGLVEADAGRGRKTPGVFHGGKTLQSFKHDLNYALRSLRQRPFFALSAIFILTLGIASNSAIFSVASAVLLQPLPFRSAQDLVFLWASPRDTNSRRSVSFADFQDWSDSPALVSATAFSNLYVSLRGPEQVVRVSSELVSRAYLSTLGLQAHLGSGFSAGRGQQVMLSYGFWQARYGADGEILGRTLQINGLPWTVVGVMPEGYDGIDGGAQLWLPLDRFDQLSPQLRRLDVLNNRRIRWLSVIARLAPGVGEAEARSQLDALAARLEEEHPQTNENLGIALDPLRELLLGDFRQPLLALSLAVAGLLLLVCANLANLLLARSAGREREMAVRLALGAGRGRLLRQLLLESAFLGLAGGLSALLLTFLSVDMLARLSPLDLPPLVHLRVDWGVLAATLLVSLAAGLLFGMLPALRLSKANLGAVFKSSSATLVGGLGKRRLSGLLVTTEVALCLLLLISAGLVLKGIWKMSRFDPGYPLEGLAAFRLELPPEEYDNVEKQGQTLRRIQERLQSLPAVRSAALASHIFFSGGYLRTQISPRGASPSESIRTLRQVVSPEFFETLGIPIRKGRLFDSSDVRRKPIPAVISQGLALRLGAEEEALGRQFEIDQGDGQEMAVVVGIVENVKPFLFRDSETLQLYTLDSNAWNRTVALRFQGDFASMAASVRGVIGQIDSDIPVFDFTTLSSRLRERGRGLHSMSQMLSIFALLAVLLAISGVYGVVSQTVSVARPEIGLRLALGAGRIDIAGRFLIFAGLWAGLGIALGLAGAWATTGLLTSHLYHVDPLDGQVFLGVALALSLSAIAAALMPALRASRTDPLRTLRCD